MSPLFALSLLFAYYVVFPIVSMAFLGFLLAVGLRMFLWIFRVGK